MKTPGMSIRIIQAGKDTRHIDSLGKGRDLTCFTNTVMGLHPTSLCLFYVNICRAVSECTNIHCMWRGERERERERECVFAQAAESLLPCYHLQETTISSVVHWGAGGCLAHTHTHTPTHPHTHTHTQRTREREREENERR